MPRQIARPLGVLALLVLTSALPLAQQQQRSTEVRNFEVVSVTGNKVVVKDQVGTEEITVPPDFRFTVGNQRIPVQQLRPGMKGTATITTTTTVTPVHVTEVRNGKVIQVSANSMILQGPDGFKMYTAQDIEKSGARISKDGQPIEFSKLSVGDLLTATIVTAAPPKVVTEREVQATLLQAPTAAGGAKSGTVAGPAAGPAAANPIADAAAPAPAPASSFGASASDAAVQTQAVAEQSAPGLSFSSLPWRSWPVLWSFAALLAVLIIIAISTKSRRVT